MGNTFGPSDNIHISEPQGPRKDALPEALFRAQQIQADRASARLHSFRLGYGALRTLGKRT